MKSIIIATAALAIGYAATQAAPRPEAQAAGLVGYVAVGEDAPAPAPTPEAAPRPEPKPTGVRTKGLDRVDTGVIRHNGAWWYWSKSRREWLIHSGGRWVSPSELPAATCAGGSCQLQAIPQMQSGCISGSCQMQSGCVGGSCSRSYWPARRWRWRW